MRKFIAFIVLTLFVISTPVFAATTHHDSSTNPFSETTGEQTTSAAWYTGRCAISSVMVITDGSNNATLIIKDSTADSGTVVFEMTVVAGDHYGIVNYSFPKTCTTGIYGKISGTGASYIIDYRIR